MSLNDQLELADKRPLDSDADANALSVIVMSDSEARRKLLRDAISSEQARVSREVRLPSIDDLVRFLDTPSDVLVVDIAENPDAGLQIVETACALRPLLTVMVWAHAADSGLLVRSMRAGAREFLSDPMTPQALSEAFQRINTRRDEIQRQKKSVGNCLVFAGAKGGAGVTTVAVNFAIALADETGQKVALLDLDMGLGDAALEMGIASEFSTLDALRNEERMDSEFVSKLLVRHSSGVYVLAAADEYTATEPSLSAVMKLVNILRFDFPWLVVDAGNHFAAYGKTLFEIADKVYLVTQVAVPDLRNANRFVRAFTDTGNAAKIQVVLNRYAMRAGEIDEESIAKALTVAPSWRIPNDFDTVHAAENTATPVVLKNGSIARVLRQMARVACGKSPEDTRKRRFSLFS